MRFFSPAMSERLGSAPSTHKSTYHYSNPDLRLQEQEQAMTDKPVDGNTTNISHAPGNPGQQDVSSVKDKGIATETLTGPFKKLPSPDSWAGRNPVLIRCLTIIGITIFLLIPLEYFTALVDERAELHDEAVRNITESWGKKQTIQGPALIIPYANKPQKDMSARPKNRSKKMAPGDKERKEDTKPIEVRYYIIFPKKLDFAANLASEKRYRGIYSYMVYTAPITIKGSYVIPSEGLFADATKQFFWDQSFFCLGLTDLKAIVSMGTLSWNGTPALQFAPGLQPAKLLGPGFHTKVSLTPQQKEYSFALELTVNGSGGMYFAPVGESTSISMVGTWPHPNFDAQLLPAKRTITENGFSAEWSVSSLSRTYPQHGDLAVYLTRGEDYSYFRTFTAGVSLYETVSLYRQVTRAVKYGILFIGLTFTALFCFELASRRQLHLVQYGLVGVAMTLFYLVLLSFAEQIAFEMAFILASSTSALMCSVYVAAALRSKKSGLLIFSLLSGLYGILFALLRMEEFSLMVGTVLVILVVCGLMYFTRNLRPRDASQE